MSELFINVRGGGAVSVPPSQRYLTTYILLEQETWFEKEIGFVARVLRPGMRAIDIGANFGVYTLAMARAVGPDGTVWAYEPASVPGAYLRRTIAHNALAQVQLLPIALSDREGSARLRLFDNSELNRITTETDGGCEQVSLSTLDRQQESFGWQAVDFIKIDAEGGEMRIIAGGHRFFAVRSPLVMFEVKNDAGSNDADALQEAFRARGYRIFRLIGPDRLLVPFEPGETLDASEINLFACKPDRAATLAAAGLLASEAAATQIPRGLGLTLWRRQDFAQGRDRAALALDPPYEHALDAYAAWRDPNRPAAERWSALRAALAVLTPLAAGTRNAAHLSTFARVAAEAGLRAAAAQALTRFLQVTKAEPRGWHEPSWPAAARYDAITPAAEFDTWFLAAGVEAFEQLRAYSSYFTEPKTLPLLDWLQSTQFASAPMERRRQLLAIRAGRPRGAPAPILATPAPDHLNARVWDAGIIS